MSGPAAGLISVTVAQVAILGSFEAFLLAVLTAGVIQICLGLARVGFVAVFFPSSVVKGLLAGIGVTIILKQIPHILGRDADPMGDKSFFQPDNENTFTELIAAFSNIHPGAALIGLISIAMIALRESAPVMRVPSPLP